MASPFAAIEAASVTHALAALSNATATISGASVSGVFDNGFAGSFGDLVGDTSPAFTAATADVSSVVVGASITINATAYTVARVEPDGTGVTRLVLK